MKKGTIFDIKEFTIHDGPGIRTTVFLKGCPLRCKWCHNPEGLSASPQLMISYNGCTDCRQCREKCTHTECQPFDRCIYACKKGLIQISGQSVSAIELATKLRKQSETFESGITISGGEPTMQWEFLFELLDELKGIHTVVETCGHISKEIFASLMQKCSMIYLDIKHMDNFYHKKLTGVSNKFIQNNLEQLMYGKSNYIIRMPLIPSLNDQEENLISLALKLKNATNKPLVEFLPLNPFTEVKYHMVGMEYQLEGISAGDYEPKIPEEIYKKCEIEYRIL